MTAEYRPPELPVPEWPDSISYDAVIIGAGPNGLIAGAYLAKAGMKVCVVERRYEIGGGLATEEILFPGHYSNPHAIYHMMVDYMPPMRDLGLDKHGLNFVSPNAQTAAVFDDGTSLLLCRMSPLLVRWPRPLAYPLAWLALVALVAAASAIVSQSPRSAPASSRRPPSALATAESASTARLGGAGFAPRIASSTSRREFPARRYGRAPHTSS